MNGVSTSIWMREKWFEKIKEYQGKYNYKKLLNMYLELVGNVEFLENNPIERAIEQVIKSEKKVNEILEYFEKCGIKQVWSPGKDYNELKKLKRTPNERKGQNE